ncbi:protein kinase domain-containing protein [Leptolyngbya ohadii]|uniref:serine/threonine-protein kinase n=1 Tax=Leptolyngbya ohadii TaxID=1962290 RepID=UPI000B59DACB|nr:serine/threonine-protein kinase [Leptolyngbya ohadii]
MLAPGNLLQNRYRILHPLGKGGFSQVFEVEENGTRKVLKILNLGELQPSQYQKAIALFQREVEVLSQFCHPGVPQIEPEGYFVLQQGKQPLHCLVMEKIAGDNLQQWREKGGMLSQQQAIDWLKQLITILKELHRQQFFHRDIKPANIMLRPGGQLVLIDFGAVREITLTYLVKQEQQETGTAIISAGYTPPEQAEGQAVPQSDFFALGRTFVHLFTGKDPIDLPKDPQTGRLCWRDRVQSRVSPLLADLIDDLMAPFPGQRPPNCEAILKTVQTIERQIILQRWIPLVVWLTRLRLKQDKRRWLSRWLTPIGLGLAASGSVMLWANRISISDKINDQGLSAYEANNQQVAGWLYQLALLFDPQSSSANFNLGTLYEDWQQVDRAMAAYQTVVKGDRFALDRWKSLNNLARLYLREGQYEAAMPLLQEGLKLVDQPKDQYTLRKNLGWAYLGLKQYDAAEKELQKAIAFDSEQAAAHCLMVPVLKANVKISDALESLNLCLKYANANDPDYWVLSDLARSAFPSSEVQP